MWNLSVNNLKGKTDLCPAGDNRPGFRIRKEGHPVCGFMCVKVTLVTGENMKKAALSDKENERVLHCYE